jgi:hypothetical protein
VSVTAHEQFRNTDFEKFLLWLAKHSSFGDWGVAAVIAACGFDTSPAVFDHTAYIRGNADGSYNWSYHDTKRGGCSDLVRHNDQSGFGTFKPGPGVP